MPPRFGGPAVSRWISKATSSWRPRPAQDYSSVSPKTEQKLSETHQSSRTKQWQRNVGFGLALGGLGYLAYGLYSTKQSRDAFISYKLIQRYPVSSTASIFILQPQEGAQNLDKHKEAWQRGIWNVHFKQPQLQIVRPYTPLPPEDLQSEDYAGNLRFYIRNDVFGEVSNYLHRLPIGSQIELRGPNIEYEISPDVKQIVFFAGGTGIAPALQVAHALFSYEAHGRDATEDRKLHILWANRKREDCIGGRSDDPPVQPLALKTKLTGIFSTVHSTSEVAAAVAPGLMVEQLERLKKKYPGHVTVEYFVNEENTWIDQGAVSKALSRFDDTDFSSGSLSSQNHRQILISGPSGFISYLAGPKEWRGGKEEQGGISKILAHALSTNPHNVKVWKI
jgi:NAD(P)H-flavin reductase